MHTLYKHVRRVTELPSSVDCTPFDKLLFASIVKHDICTQSAVTEFVANHTKNKIKQVSN